MAGFAEPVPALDENAETLLDCCRRRCIALVVVHDVQGVCEARFGAVTDGTVELMVSCAQALPGFRQGAMCTVSFHHESQVRLFFSRVLDYRPSVRGGPPARLILALPTSVVAKDARLTSRIPVVNDAGLSVVVRADEGSIPVRALDVSANGILVELPDDFGLAMDDEVEVELRFEELGVTLPGVVRRRHDDRSVGLSFPTTVSGNSVRAPIGLREIVDRLERMWLRRPSRIPEEQ